VSSTQLIMTVGHSTRTAGEFRDLLHAHSVQGIADVRRFPASRRHPHFSREALTIALPADSIAYRHFPELGGRRAPRHDSLNTAWRHPSFRAYADHMATEEFARGFAALIAFAATCRIAVMCAEAQWWRCHRQLIADALVARGISVAHIMSPTAVQRHELTTFARVDAFGVTYPGLL
jgi:uncharacterized protein (DUF488 family)